MAVAAPSPWQISLHTPTNNLSLAIYRIPEDSSYPSLDRSRSPLHSDSNAGAPSDSCVRGGGVKALSTSLLSAPPQTDASPKPHSQPKLRCHSLPNQPTGPRPDQHPPARGPPSLAEYFSATEVQREMMFAGTHEHRAQGKAAESRMRNPTLKRGLLRGVSDSAAACDVSTRGGLVRGMSTENLGSFFRFS